RTPSSGTLGAAVNASRFETDALGIPLVPPTLAAELAPFRRLSHAFERLVRALGRLLGERALSRAVGWDDVLQSEAGGEGGRGGSALTRFERDLGALNHRFAGPFLNGELYALYFRAQLHAAFERAGHTRCAAPPRSRPTGWATCRSPSGSTSASWSWRGKTTPSSPCGTPSIVATPGPSPPKRAIAA